MQPLQDIPTRRRLITEARNKSESRELVQFRDSYQSLPVAMLPLELPVYRAGNGRLAVLKAEYLRKHNKDHDFFEQHEESSDVQTALYEMLIELAKDQEASIYQELYNTAVQTERLLVTSDGVVVDGNRRLASMRTLHDLDPDRFAGFKQIEAILLPEDATAIDLELVEANRQLAPNTKLAYSWIDRRLKLRYHKYNLEIPENVICNTYRLRSSDQLHIELQELELAEQYLDEYLGQSRDYLLIEHSEKHFIGLRRELDALKDEQLKNIWRLIGFAMIKETNNLKIDPGNYFPLGPLKYNFTQKPVLELYGEQKGLWSFSEELGSGTVINTEMYKKLINDLNDEGSSNNIAESVIQLFNQTIVEHEDRPHPIYVVNHLRNISKMLSKIDLNKFTRSQRREMFGHLAEVDYHVRQLLNKESPKPDDSLIVISFSGIFRKLYYLLVRVYKKVKSKIIKS